MKHIRSIPYLLTLAILSGCGGGETAAPPPPSPPPPSAALVYTALHTFTGGTDGKNPAAGLIRDEAGNLYGTTTLAGDMACLDGFGFGCGTVFKLDSNGVLTTLHAFAGGAIAGAFPAAGLVRDASGNLYGVTNGGGNRNCVQGCGTVFKLDAAGNHTVLYYFTGRADGLRPNGHLIRDVANNWYGTVAEAGDPTCPNSGGRPCGAIFKLDSTGSFTTLHVFEGGPTDGAAPNSGLVRDAADNLYGTTGSGGHQFGTVFKLDATGTESVLHHFTGEDGAYPEGLVADEAGNLYGTTKFGGKLECDDDFFGCGTLFKLDPDGTLTTLRVFGERSGDLRRPSPDLIRDSSGNLYGTTSGGGTHDFGTVFKLSASGSTTVLYSFTGIGQGIDRRLGVKDSAGNFYGTAFGGGDTTCDPTNGGCGIVFKIGHP